MAHFGLICPAAPSHLNTITTLGYELKQRGHRVTLLGVEYAKQKALAMGLEFQETGKTDFPEGSTQKIISKLSNLHGIKALRYSFAIGVKAARTCLEDAPKAAQTAGIEAMLVDQCAPEGGTVADYLGIPFVTICNGVMTNQEIGVPPFITSWNYDPSWKGLLRNKVGYELLNYLEKSLRETINSYRKQWNLATFSNFNESYSSLAQLCHQPAEFEFPRQELPLSFHFTGPYSHKSKREPVPFPYEKLTGEPLIYVSMGTIQNGLLWIFQMIAEACAPLKVQVVIALGGGHSPDSLANLPGNPLVVGYAPQLELLKKATLVITHAGMNTTLESLTNGVPMIAIPITNDQPAVAARIAWTGTGKVLPLSQVSVQKLQQFIKQVLTEDSYKNNAIRLQQAIKDSGGVRQAADIIEQAIFTGKPVFSKNQYTYQ
ncbi:glycosyltransferase [Gloeothece verrucosa]|uniref:Glycosyltransferase, MGT family n=1 Tax=Gloeothece verrucosa (strain PCC 7822) TaxID=497965 RepID=E0UEB5_GLOV7|nr:glycosyltransferase [Gloeothece verrucosa]ADN14240.1 glycosyltransferase, MGT family [Gloeothece verrucosa PCC 7822]